MVLSLEGVHRAVAGVPRPPPRVIQPWLNIVFDLNGILCVCEEFRLRPIGQDFTASTLPHSSTVPAKVGPKLVYVRPGCHIFLEAVSKFATVSVWSSMRANTARDISRYLFRDLKIPKVEFGQEHCQKVLVSVDKGVRTYLKVENTEKEVFLKSLERNLFTQRDGSFTKENTIIIDDSPYKHVVNDPENVLLLDSWSYQDNGRDDSYLLDVLLPWLRRLHNSAELGLSSFRHSNPLGRPALSSDPYDLEYTDLMEAILKSNNLSWV